MQKIAAQVFEAAQAKDPHIMAAAARLLQAHLNKLYSSTDRLLAVLLLVQWFAGIVVAAVFSPYSWAGTQSSLHIHVVSAVFLGGAIIAFPLYSVISDPGKTITRHSIAVAQMLYSALLIHLLGGRIEGHFHVFASLAVLSFYRDWRVLVTATVVVAIDHIVRGALFPVSVYGTAVGAQWRWVEHALWVVAEDTFLIISCNRNHHEMEDIALKRAILEEVNRRAQGTLEEAKDELAEQRKRVAETNERLAQVLRCSNDAIISRTVDGTICSWNAAATTMFGWTEEEVVGRDFAEMFVPLALQDQYLDFQKQILEGEQVANFETERLRKNGTTVPVAVTMSPVFDGCGRLVGYSHILRDITSKKEQEQRMAEFYSTVSHELRTPLTSIRGALALIADGIVESNSEEGEELVNIAKNSSDRLVRLINDILDLRKIEAGKMELNFTELSSSAILMDTLNALRGFASEKSVKLVPSIESDASILADSDRITQVLTNLVSNAVKFSPADSEVVVELSVRDSGAVRFVVSDKGPGIPFDKQSKIFGKFVQADSSDSRAKEGTGLGLAISKAIVEEHGGKIGFSSIPDQGSTFWFELPPNVLMALAAAPKRIQRTEAVAESPKRILLVDDDAAARKVVAAQLRDLNVELLHAKDGIEGLALMATHNPDLIILDVGLPYMDGFAVVEALRRHSNPDLPLVIYSGRDLSCEERRRLSLGPTRHITKGRLKESEFLSTIEELSGARKKEATTAKVDAA